MSRERWAHVDAYLESLFGTVDSSLTAALRSSADAGLPDIAVSAGQGRLLHFLAGLGRARRILEIGTLGGYSTIWLARALASGGSLVTLERDPKHADVARRNLERAGLADRVDLRVGVALDTLAQLTAERAAPFDFVFLDADKPTYPEYLEAALELCAPGALIVADNVIRDGAVADDRSADPNVVGVRRFLERCASEPRLASVVLQTVGAKGYDGFLLARVASRTPRGDAS
jgi:predicted O-methyltransferase YrrM